MALSINTDSLKNISNMVIECQLAQQVGLQIFNNLGTTTPEYTELCEVFKISCEKIITDAEKLKSAIPTI